MKIKWISNNFWIKFWALLLAIGLWFYVAGEETIEVNMKMPISLILAEDMLVTEQGVMNVNVMLKGRKDVIEKLKGKELYCRIDLSAYSESEVIILSIEPEYFSFGKNINILNIYPKQLKIKIDKLSQRVLPVKLITEGGAAAGYRMESFTIDPVAAMIKGPEGVLKDLVYIDTEPVDITGRTKSFKKMVPLKSVAALEDKLPPQFVEVFVKIGEVPEEMKDKYNDNKSKKE